MQEPENLTQEPEYIQIELTRLRAQNNDLVNEAEAMSKGMEAMKLRFAAEVRQNQPTISRIQAL